MCLPGSSNGEDVRLQEAWEEEDKEEERRVYGPQREADPGESQQQICSKYLISASDRGIVAVAVIKRQRWGLQRLCCGLILHQMDFVQLLYDLDGRQSARPGSRAYTVSRGLMRKLTDGFN